TPLSISRRAFVEGLRDTLLATNFRGRWQILSTNPTVICDTAHNPDGIRVVAEQLQTIEQGKLYAVMGFCEDKDIKKMLSLMPKQAHYIFTRAESRRAASAEQIAAIATELGLDFEWQATSRQAVEYAKSLMNAEDTLFIGGSTFVLAEILPQ
ncbi:MAG: bifunctional folylpolyglutamate synthase/dihydrofolate synthase, partial [Alistipes sp.]|nr:bifunctional folylpolyglutamate synthase/dihydrofolate synthase [Alistipes sp.]